MSQLVFQYVCFGFIEDKILTIKKKFDLIWFSWYFLIKFDQTKLVKKKLVRYDWVSICYSFFKRWFLYCFIFCYYFTKDLFFLRKIQIRNFREVYIIRSRFKYISFCYFFFIIIFFYKKKLQMRSHIEWFFYLKI